MPRVLLITYDFPPSVEIGAHACEQVSRHLPRYGWQPVVLTIGERYIDPARIDRQFSRRYPGLVHRTRVFPHPLDVYRRFKSSVHNRIGFNGKSAGPQRERIDFRTWLLSLLLVPDMYTGWIIPAVAAGMRLVRTHQIAHIFSSAPCWTNHLIGLLLSRLTGLPWTVHFRDPWTQVDHWKPASATSRRIERCLESMVLRRVTTVVCVTDPHTKLLRASFPYLPSEKFHTILNGYDGEEWEALDLRNGNGCQGPSDHFVITYAGSLWQRRSPLPLFRALGKLVTSGEVKADSLRIDLIGWCEVAQGQQVHEMAAAHGIGACLSLVGPLGRAQTLSRLVASNLLLLLAEDWTLQIPGKTYEYLRSGRPILALTQNGALADLLRMTGGGWVMDPDDEVAITAALRQAYVNWSVGTLNPVADSRIVTSFDRRLLAGRYAELFDFATSAAGA